MSTSDVISTSDISKKRQIAETGSDVESQKKAKTTIEPTVTNLSTLLMNPLLEDSSLLEKLKNSWTAHENYDSEDCTFVKLGKFPFLHGEIKDILVDPLPVFQNLQKSLRYEEKSSDLFHFRQSCDLSTMSSSLEGYESVKAICDFIETKVFKTIQSITSLPLNGTFDAFASQYQQKDHLLCHDDELDSRRIAFILYMNEEWHEKYGGTLDLFDSLETDDGIQPGKIVKSIVPAFNKLAFFEVSAKSFHQVSEVLTDSVSRFAISGWFYGSPLPRPPLQLPEDIFTTVDFLECQDGSLEENLDSSYLDPEVLESVNQKLTENSEILLSNFLKPELYSSTLSKLENIKDSQWKTAGPTNLRNFQHLLDSDLDFPQETLSFYKTKAFLEFLQGISEFPFASEPELRFTCSLQKFEEGSFSLIRGKERHYGKPDVENSEPLLNNDDDNEVSNSEDEHEHENEKVNHVNGDTPMESGESSHQNDLQKNENQVNVGKNNDDDDDENENAKENTSVEIIESESNVKDGQDDSADDEENDENMNEDEDEGFEIIEDDSDGEEEAPEPNRIDVMFFLIPDDSTSDSTANTENNVQANSEQNGNATSPTTCDKNSSDESLVDSKTKNQDKTSRKWDERYGGNKIYTDDLTGKQLINLVPQENSLAIVVRDESISSHYSYISKALAKGRKYFCLNIEFKFPTQAAN